MKKIFTFFAAALMAASVLADEPAATIQLQAAREAEPGICTFFWSADGTKSAYFLVMWSQVDMTTYTTTPIAMLAGAPSAFAVQGYDGIYGTSTKIMFTYGTTYPVIKDNTSIDSETKAAWKAGWEYVDPSDYTLQGGSYYVTVTGYASDQTTITDKKAYAVVTLDGKTEGVINVFESNKPVKFIDANGQVRIMRDGKVFNMSGARVE